VGGRCEKISLVTQRRTWNEPTTLHLHSCSAVPESYNQQVRTLCREPRATDTYRCLTRNSHSLLSVSVPAVCVSMSRNSHTQLSHATLMPSRPRAPRPPRPWSLRRQDEDLSTRSRTLEPHAMRRGVGGKGQGQPYPTSRYHPCRLPTGQVTCHPSIVILMFRGTRGAYVRRENRSMFACYS
jgi:hypothetical protein